MSVPIDDGCVIHLHLSILLNYLRYVDRDLRVFLATLCSECGQHEWIVSQAPDELSVFRTSNDSDDWIGLVCWLVMRFVA